MRYIKRDIEKVLKIAVKEFPAVILTGPRQSGKTTLLKHLFSKNYKYISLDEPDMRIFAKKDPHLFFKNFPPPVIIDKIQYVPELLPFIKIYIDDYRNKKGLFLLTGSQHFPLMARITETLAGRIAVFNLLSFSFREKFFLKNRPNGSIFRKGQRKTINMDFNSFKESILRGGFPEIYLDKKRNTRLWFASYLQTYLERDIRQLRNIGDLYDFQRFLELLASYNGQILNLSSIAGNLGVAVNTIKTWISLLEASGQIFLVKPFYINKGKRIIKSPKVYFLDTGLLCYLSGITDISQIFKGILSGSLLETLVLGEIIRYFYSTGEIPRCYWWRTSSGIEVDFIVETEGNIIPIEVKMSTKIRQEMMRGLISFKTLFKDRIKKSFLINLSDKRLSFSNGIEILPFLEFIG